MASSARVDELRKKFEENPRRYFAPLANEYRKAGEIEQAIAICREYLPQQPGHMSGHIVFGQALYEARQFDEAKSVFETALSLDPENLIALRHLGDIALIVGDADGARGWYKRVLEADPRNEEIQAQLATLDKAGSGAPTPAAATPAVASPAVKPTPSSAPTVVQAAIPRPSPIAATVPIPIPVTQPIPIPAAKAAPPAAKPPPAAPVTASSETQPFRLDTLSHRAEGADEPMDPAVDIGIMGAAESAGAGAPVESLSTAGTIEVQTNVVDSSADAPIDSFTLDGLETTSMAAPPPPPEPPPVAQATELPDLDMGMPDAAPPAAEAPPPAASDALPDLDLGMPADAPPAETPAAAPVAELPELDISMPAAPDLEISMPAAAPDLDITMPDAEPAPAASGDLEFLDLGSSAPPASEPAPPPIAAAPVAVPADDDVEPIADFDLGDLGAPRAPAPAASPAPIAAPPMVFAAPVAEPEMEPEPATAPPESGPFVTETMAELYLQQGHRDEALRVYRALLEQRPGDAALVARIASLETPAVVEHEVAPPSPEYSGPTIREILMVVALRRPGYRPPPIAGNGATHAPAQTGFTPAEDRLRALFGDVVIGEADEWSALMLATTFASTNGADHGEASAISGSPAHPASSELSLSTVFGGAQAPADPSSFSYDQFFSQRATSEHAAAHKPHAAAPESPEDVARFSQWLEGLKQR